VTEAALKARVTKLDWLAPGFRDDLAAFALQSALETGVVFSFRPVPGTPQPQCETRAEMVVAALNWIRPDGGEQQVQANGLAHYPAGQALVRALHGFTGQFTQTLQADASPLRLILSQSHGRAQQRLRDNPRLASVWVKNPGTGGGLILIDPQTGHPHAPSGKVMTVPQAMGPAMFKTDPPCSLPKLEAYAGPTRGIFIDLGDGKGHPFGKDGNPVLVPSPAALSFTHDQAVQLGLLDPRNLDYSRSLCLHAERRSFEENAAYAMSYPLVRTFAEMLDGLDKALLTMAEGEARSLDDLEQAIEDLFAAARGDASEPFGADVHKARSRVFTLTSDRTAQRKILLAIKRIRLVDLPRANVIIKALKGSKGVWVEFRSTPSVDLTAVPWENTTEGEPLSALQGVSFLAPLHGTKTFPAEAFFQSHVRKAYNFHPNDFKDARLQPFFIAGEVMAGLAFAAGGPVTVIPAAILSAAGSSDNMTEFLFSLGAKGFGAGTARAAMKGLNLDQAARRAMADTRVTLKDFHQHQVFMLTLQTMEEMLSLFFEEMGEWIAESVSDTKSPQETD
jgi:hypothetical protein